MTTPDIQSLVESVLRLDKEAAPAPWLPEVWMNFDEGGFAAIGPHHQPGDSDEEREDNAEPETPTGNAAKLDAKLISEYRTAAPILARACNEKDAELVRLRAELAEEKRKVEAIRMEFFRAPHEADCVVNDIWPHNDRCTCWKEKANERIAALTAPSEKGEL